MIEYLKKECCLFSGEFQDWRQLLTSAGALLEDAGYINGQYTRDMISSIETNGPYIVVMPGIALAHARPEGNVYKNAISLITLKRGVEFGHSHNDPVKALFVVAAVSDEEHLKLFQVLSSYLMDNGNVEKLFHAEKYEDLTAEFGKRIAELEGGLIVSCYADQTINKYMDNSEVMKHVALSCIAGGATAIRTNLEHVKAIKDAVDVPVIGIKKIYKGNDELNSSFRITPTMKEVDALVAAGADGIAVDATQRERYDELTFAEFIQSIREKYPHLFIVADISTLEEGVRANECGVDAVGTTLSGYTPYSKNPILFGTVPAPDPDYEIIAELVKAGVKRIIAEGRINDGIKMKKSLEAGAFAVVIGTSITEPKKIVETIMFDAKHK